MVDIFSTFADVESDDLYNTNRRKIILLHLKVVFKGDDGSVILSNLIGTTVKVTADNYTGECVLSNNYVFSTNWYDRQLEYGLIVEEIYDVTNEKILVTREKIFNILDNC